MALIHYNITFTNLSIPSQNFLWRSTNGLTKHKNQKQKRNQEKREEKSPKTTENNKKDDKMPPKNIKVGTGVLDGPKATHICKQNGEKR